MANLLSLLLGDRGPLPEVVVEDSDLAWSTWERARSGDSGFVSSGELNQPNGHRESVGASLKTQSSLSRDSLRRALIRLALKNVLTRHEIPAEFVQAEMAEGTVDGKPFVHLRLVARTAEPALLANLYDIQRAFEAEVLSIDRTSPEWLVGLSWRLESHGLDPVTHISRPETWHRLSAERRLRGLAAGTITRTRQELDSEFSVFQRTGAFQIDGDFEDTQPTL